MSLHALTMAALLMAAADPQADAAQRIRTLRQEQIATLKKLADQTALQFRNRFGLLEDAIEARLLLFRAELDAAESDRQRLKLHEDLVKALKEFEKGADALVKAGQAKTALFLKAKARRLEAEIALERTKRSR